MCTQIGTLTRVIAIDALTHILSRKMHSDIALEKLFSHHTELRPLDKSFIYEMVLGSLRWLSKMDWIMGHMLNRPFHTLDPRVANALRIGAYQIYYMDRVPERAAVSETVEAVKKVGVPNASSLVNAILRRVAKKAEYFPKPDRENNLLDYYCMHYSHPIWMVKRWYDFIPHDRVEHLLNGNNQTPKNFIRILKKNQPNFEAVYENFLKNHALTPQWKNLPYTIEVDRLPRFDSCEQFQNGDYIVQDEAIQLATSLVSCSPDDTVLDACSAPGGKAIALWDQGLQSKNLTLCDVSKKRLDVLKSNLKRVKIEDAEIILGDVSEVCQGRTFSKVLLDAPCSSTGVLRRHPEIKWLKKPEDIIAHAKEQRRLLDAMAPLVKEEGELIYMVCSIEKEETVQVMEEFLAAHPQFERVDLHSRTPAFFKKYLNAQGELLIYPGNHEGMDGFFTSVLKRV